MKNRYSLIVLIFTLYILVLIIAPFASVARAAEINNSCDDSDNGVNYNEQGVSEGNWLTNRTNYVYEEDACKDDKKTIVEFYCDEGFLYKVERKCPNFCQYGSCVKELAPEIEENKSENLSAAFDLSNVSENNSRNISESNISENNNTILLNDTLQEESEVSENFSEIEKLKEKKDENSGFMSRLINWIKSIFSKKHSN